MNRFLTSICMTAFFALPLESPAAMKSASAGKRFEASLYGHVENFEWKEFDSDGNRLLEESGPLAGIGGVLKADTGIGFQLEGLIDFFLGRVDYDGATQSGIPVESKTDYGGGMGEASIIWPLNIASGFQMGPCAGAGGRAWRREIEDSGEALGYVENWLSLYGILGIRAAAKIGSAVKLSGKAAVKMPFYNNAQYDFSNLAGPYNVEVEPGKKAGPYAEAALSIGNFTIAGFYEQMNFLKSDTADVGRNVIVWQPESEAKIFGLRAGVVF